MRFAVPVVPIHGRAACSVTGRQTGFCVLMPPICYLLQFLQTELGRSLLEQAYEATAPRDLTDGRIDSRCIWVCLGWLYPQHDRGLALGNIYFRIRASIQSVIVHCEQV